MVIANSVRAGNSSRGDDHTLYRLDRKRHALPVSYEQEGLDALVSVSRARDTDARARLREQAWSAAFDERGLLESVRRQYEESAERAVWARQVLDTVHDHDVRVVRRELAAFLRDAPEPEDRPTALIAGEGATRTGTLDVVLLEHFGRVSRIPSGGRFVARAIHDQPDIALIHDDLRELDALAAALLVRVYAPATMVVIITDEPELLANAERAGVPTAPSIVDAEELDDLLARLAA